MAEDFNSARSNTSTIIDIQGPVGPDDMEKIRIDVEKMLGTTIHEGVRNILREHGEKTAHKVVIHSKVKISI